MKMKQQNKKQIGAGRNFINVQKFEKTLKKPLNSFLTKLSSSVRDLGARLMTDFPFLVARWKSLLNVSLLFGFQVRNSVMG